MYAKRVSEIRIASDLARLAEIELTNPNLVYLPEKDYQQSIRTVETARHLRLQVSGRAWRTRGGKSHEKVRRG